jgi:hypothetical protein
MVLRFIHCGGIVPAGAIGCKIVILPRRGILDEK